MRFSTPAIEHYFHYLATLRWLAEKVIYDDYELDAEEINDKGHDLNELYRIGIEHGQSIKEVTTLLLRSVWDTGQNRQVA